MIDWEKFDQLVDERGDKHNLRVKDPFRHFGSRLATETLLPYLVNSMGCISVTVNARAVHACFNQDTVSHLALVGVLMLLKEHATQRVVLTGTVGGGEAEIYTHAGGLAMLSRMIEERNPRPRFWSCRVPMQQTAFDPLAHVVRDIATADIADDQKTRLLESALRKRFVIGVFDRESGEVRASAISDLITRLDPQFADRFVGKTFHTFLDREYGGWLASALSATAREAMMPVAERVRLAVQVRGQPLNTEFSRLLMPYEFKGQRMLLAASDFTN